MSENGPSFLRVAATLVTEAGIAAGAAGCAKTEVNAAARVEDQLNPNKPTSAEVLDAPPTVSPMPTEIAVTASPTPEPTATQTPTTEPTTAPTETPTTEPTEEFRLERVCENWRDVTGCSVTVEDITSGRMLQADRDLAKTKGMEMFPDEAVAIKDKFVFNDSGMNKYLWYDRSGSFYQTFKEDPTRRPYRWLPLFSEVKTIPGLEGRKSLVAVQQWLNPSGKISYLHYVVNGDRTATNDKWNKIRFEQMHFEFPIFEDDSTQSADMKLYEKIKPTFYSEETQALLEEWQQTGEIPDQLQYKLLRGVAFETRME